MSEKEAQPELKIQPPEFKFPLTAQKACDVLGIGSKSTLLRMEEEGRIPLLPRATSIQGERLIGPEQMMAILKAMQNTTYRNGMPIYGWLSQVNLDETGSFTTPTGYTIKLEPKPNVPT